MMAAVLLSGGILAGCDKAGNEVLPETGSATMVIEVDRNFSIDSTSVSVRFVPSENAAGYRYAIGTAEDFEAFRDGTMDVPAGYSGGGTGTDSG